MRQGRRLAGGILAAMLAAGTGAAAPPGGEAAGSAGAGDRPPALVESATSELVLIEVYARDSKGRPVRDLTADELVLKIDQHLHPEPIVSLEWVGEDASRGGASGTRAGGAEAGPVAGDAPGGGDGALPSGAAARRSYPRRFLLFFEDSTSAPTNMTAARMQAIAYLKRPGPATDQFALASYDSRRKLEILHDFTSDREALRATLEASLQDTIRLSDYYDEYESRKKQIDDAAFGRAAVRGIAGAAGADIASAANAIGLKRFYAGQVAQRMTRILDVVKTLVDTLAAWPGYKALVFIGDGIFENPAYEYGLDDPSLALTHELADLALAAGGDEVTLHAVSAQGVEAPARRTNALATLALNTGGVHLSSNDITGALEDVERAAEGYYVLAFAPPGPSDGLYHTVNLKVKRRRVTLRYRHGFTRFLPEQSRTRSIRAAYMAPALHDDLGLDLAAVAGPERGEKRVYDLVIYVPASRILFVPAPEGRAAVLDVGLVALDGSGRETLRVSRRVRVAIGDREDASRGARALDFFSRVRLPQGSQTLTAVVFDEQSQAVGAVRRSLGGEKTAAAGVTGLSLYAVGERSLWMEIDPDADEGDGETDLSYKIGPALRGRFARGEKVACGFRLSEPRGPEAPPLRIEILRGDEVLRVRPIPRRRTAADDGGTVHAELPIHGLAAGAYVLRVAEDRDEGDVEMARLPFRIEPAGHAPPAAERGGPPRP